MEDVKKNKKIKKDKKIKKEKKKKSGLFKYIKDCKAELKLVSWPTGKELLSNSFLVIGVVIFATIFVWGIDLGLQYLLNLLINNI